MKDSFCSCLMFPHDAVLHFVIMCDLTLTNSAKKMTENMKKEMNLS